MAGFASLIPLIESLAATGGKMSSLRKFVRDEVVERVLPKEEKRPTFRHFASPIGPDPFDPSSYQKHTSQEHKKKGETARSFFEVQRESEDAKNLLEFATKAKSATTKLVAVGAALAAARLPFKIAQWGESLVESQRDLARYNGVLAVAFGEFDRRKLVRDISTARRTAKSAKALSESISDLRDTIQPMINMFTNLTNSVGGLLASLTEEAVDPTGLNREKQRLREQTERAAAEERAKRGLLPEGEELHPFMEFVNDAKQGKLDEWAPIPPRR